MKIVQVSLQIEIMSLKWSSAGCYDCRVQRHIFAN